MTAVVMPLFRLEALRPIRAAFHSPSAAVAGRGKLPGWLKSLGSPADAKLKETELLGNLVRDKFGETIGTRPAGDRRTTRSNGNPQPPDRRLGASIPAFRRQCLEIVGFLNLVQTAREGRDIVLSSAFCDGLRWVLYPILYQPTSWPR
jgi:hypothetical protein